MLLVGFWVFLRRTENLWFGSNAIENCLNIVQQAQCLQTYVCLYVARLCIILFIWATFRVFWEEVTPVPEKFEVSSTSFGAEIGCRSN